MAKKKDIEPIEDPIEKEKAWEDLGRPEGKQIMYSYIVSVNRDGYIKTELMDMSDYIERKATTFDVYQSCKEIASNIEAQVMIDRVVEGVMKALKPVDSSEEVRKSVREALSERGIDTSKD